jgi:hypothetical protein
VCECVEERMASREGKRKRGEEIEREAGERAKRARASFPDFSIYVKNQINRLNPYDPNAAVVIRIEHEFIPPLVDFNEMKERVDELLSIVLDELNQRLKKSRLTFFLKIEFQITQEFHDEDREKILNLKNSKEERDNDQFFRIGVRRKFNEEIRPMTYIRARTNNFLENFLNSENPTERSGGRFKNLKKMIFSIMALTDDDDQQRIEGDQQQREGDQQENQEGDQEQERRGDQNPEGNQEENQEVVMNDPEGDQEQERRGDQNPEGNQEENHEVVMSDPEENQEVVMNDPEGDQDPEEESSFWEALASILYGFTQKTSKRMKKTAAFELRKHAEGLLGRDLKKAGIDDAGEISSKLKICFAIWCHIQPNLRFLTPNTFDSPPNLPQKSNLQLKKKKKGYHMLYRPQETPRFIPWKNPGVGDYRCKYCETFISFEKQKNPSDRLNDLCKHIIEAHKYEFISQDYSYKLLLLEPLGATIEKTVNNWVRNYVMFFSIQQMEDDKYDVQFELRNTQDLERRINGMSLREHITQNQLINKIEEYLKKVKNHVKSLKDKEFENCFKFCKPQYDDKKKEKKRKIGIEVNIIKSMFLGMGIQGKRTFCC